MVIHANTSLILFNSLLLLYFYIVQEAGQALAQVAPQRVSQAFIAALTAALALATGGVNGFVHGANDFADGDTAGIFT